jgi:uracil-DNA glycosylase
MVESAIAPLVLATIHPSSILRARSDDERHTAMRAFVQDLAVLAGRLSS